MNILVLSKDMNFSVTGGQEINKNIYYLLERDGHKVSFCQNLHPTKSNLGYLVSLLFHLPEYLQYDRIIIDSSSFPKTLWFVLMARLLGKREKY